MLLPSLKFENIFNNLGVFLRSVQPSLRGASCWETSPSKIRMDVFGFFLNLGQNTSKPKEKVVHFLWNPAENTFNEILSHHDVSLKVSCITHMDPCNSHCQMPSVLVFCHDRISILVCFDDISMPSCLPNERFQNHKKARCSSTCLDVDGRTSYYSAQSSHFDALYLYSELAKRHSIFFPQPAYSSLPPSPSPSPSLSLLIALIHSLSLSLAFLPCCPTSICLL